MSTHSGDPQILHHLLYTISNFQLVSLLQLPRSILGSMLIRCRIKALFGHNYNIEDSIVSDVVSHWQDKMCDISIFLYDPRNVKYQKTSGADHPWGEDSTNTCGLFEGSTTV